MVLYFTGTGNSKYAANIIAQYLDDKLVSLNEVIKNNKQKVFNSEKPFVIVSPIYAWRLPHVIEKFLKEAEFNGNKNIYFVATMGKNTGNANEYCRKICIKKGINYMGFRGVVMPDNYLIMSDIKDRKTIDKVIEMAEPKFYEIGKRIRSGEKLEKNDFTVMPTLSSSLINTCFYSLFVNSRKFYITDNCVSCGKCAKVCPVNNITLKAGVPNFSDNCIHCMACIQHCPKRAIEVKGKTEKRGRYLCPKVEM
ncbi:EFR1 family ferrodoxin [Clostridium sp. SHJSY1]|uniref:EFR1 family ferrodoxin n=1 Tax=Clostridium sp. SHJSY1 TaxID=2942483 RepID=UPI002876EE26|nr:EFR1 family ferrodoxin [Clostridium sp. SHJSY1]MDS0525279.1 EFR1 family ferrodoxin [Clostridium sp. SHJSY1]